MNDNKELLGTAPIGKLLFKLAIPTVVAQLINMLYNIVDRIYIGHMPGDGSLALTGVGVCMPIIMIVSAFAALIASGGAPRASICMGKGEQESAEKILGGCFTLQLIISATLTVVVLLPLIYIVPKLVEEKTMGVYLAEPIADVIAVIFTAILFAVQFRKSLNKLNTNRKEIIR